MGIGFVGNIGIKDFLSQYIEPKRGNIIDTDGNIVGKHDGAIFYTIGQRHGLNVGGGLPMYVVDKNMSDNTVVVTSDIDDSRLWAKQVKLVKFHVINQPPIKGSKYMVRSRHRAGLQEAKFLDYDEQSESALIELTQSSRAMTPGQSLVIYDNQQVLGGGIISLNKS